MGHYKDTSQAEAAVCKQALDCDEVRLEELPRCLLTDASSVCS